MPEKAHSSSDYILVNQNGDFRMYREYDKNHYLRLEIGSHPEASIDASHKSVLYVHAYQPDHFSDRTPRPLTEKEFQKYKKFFRGVAK